MPDEQPREDAAETPTAQEHQEAVERRVRKVRHLDPFTLSCHADGRFTAQLERSPSELEPATARAILDRMDAALEPLRRVAEPPAGGTGKERGRR